VFVLLLAERSSFRTWSGWHLPATQNQTRGRLLGLWASGRLAPCPRSSASFGLLITN